MPGCVRYIHDKYDSRMAGRVSIIETQASHHSTGGSTMKKYMLFMTALCAAGAIGCSSTVRPVQQAEAPPAVRADTVARFSSDIDSVISIINEHDLIRMLTHLQQMNAGGSKYYLLEHESISAMIRARARESYHDLILVNSSGTVLFTLLNQPIFAKNVASFYPASPLYRCFRSGMSGVQCAIGGDPGKGEAPSYISAPVVKNAEIRGVLIFQIRNEDSALSMGPCRESACGVTGERPVAP